MGFIFAIPGLLRTVGSALVALAPIVESLPVQQVAAWGPVLSQVGAAICGLGIVRAGVRNYTGK